MGTCLLALADPHGRNRMDLRVQNLRQYPNLMLGSDPIQFNEGDDDLQPNGESQTASSSDGAESNRPAANANLSETVDATTEEFEFSDDADDFLGLESEVEELEAASSNEDESEANFNVSESGELDISDGWLLEVASEENSAPVQEASSEIESADSDQIEGLVETAIASAELGEEVFDTDTLVEDGSESEFDDDFEHDQDEETEDDFDAEYDEEFDEDENAEPASFLSKKMVLIGFCAGILGTVGLLMTSSEPGDDVSGVELASGTPTAPVTPVEASGAETSVENTNTADSTTDATEAESTEPIEDVLEGLLAAPMEDAAATESEPITFGEGSDLAMSADSIAAVPSLPSLPSMPDMESVEFATPDAEAPRSVLTKLAEGAENGDISGFMEFTPASGSGFIWTGEEVPTASISTKGRILTPAVGLVRATMHSGELFEGNLYAVGSDRVWIEMGLGRVGLDGKKIQKIVRVVEESRDGGTPEPTLGQRVRIRAAGGVLYGKVKSREGSRVTIVTDKGARITLLDPQIEPIGRLSGLVLN